MRDFLRAAGAIPETHAARVNLIIYLVESLVDPRDLGLKFTSEPIPSLRAAMAGHASGHAVVPGLFGGSANSEFELLTAMSMSFLPERSCPFNQYIKRDLPTLPRLLKQQGYRTVAVHVDVPSLYNRREVYPHLGFDKIRWLSEENRQSKDVQGLSVSDDAVVDALIEESEGERPFFAFAFPSSTHCPYDYTRYLQSSLDVTTPLPAAAHRELKTTSMLLRLRTRRLESYFLILRSPIGKRSFWWWVIISRLLPTGVRSHSAWL